MILRTSDFQSYNFLDSYSLFFSFFGDGLLDGILISILFSNVPSKISFPKLLSC